MKRRTMWTTVAVVAVLALLAGGAGALQERDTLQATVASKINYQGRLTNPGGTPLDGTFPMRFQIWNAAVGGVYYYDSGEIPVNVDNGLFNVELNPPQAAFDGRELWLQMWVDGEWLSPRQELTPVPYALSLRPGAEIAGDSQNGWGLSVDWSNTAATGGAVYGTSATSVALFGRSPGGYGLYGYSEDNYGVVGYSRDSEGGHLSSTNGYGLRVNTDGTDHWDHAGWFTADWGYGVYAQSTYNYGVVGEGVTAGVRGTGTNQGVSGSSTNGSGVSGYSYNNIGVDASSHDYWGLLSFTYRPDNNYGVYTYDNVYALSYHVMGAIMQVAQNGGEEPLELGDVVVLSGMTALPEADAPAVMQVSGAASANSPAVAGVVYSRFNIETAIEDRKPGTNVTAAPREVTPAGPVAPREYLLVVVQGPAQVKASALTGEIQPGDLLSTATLVNHAAKAPRLIVEGIEMVAPGTLLGKAMEPLQADQELIYVYVTLQ
ncbi:MAG: hypothetical protein PVJ26_12955 [Anaerolineae bacterium]